MAARQSQRRLLAEYGLYVRDCSNKVGIDRYHILVATQGREHDRQVISIHPQDLPRFGNKETRR
jgi:hypothetical protein